MITGNVYLGIDKDGQEWIFAKDEDRNNCKSHYNFIPLPAGTINKIIGRSLKKHDEPFELINIIKN